MNNRPSMVIAALLAGVVLTVSGCSTGGPVAPSTSGATSAGSTSSGTPSSPTPRTTASPSGTPAPAGVITFDWGWPNAPARPAAVTHSYSVPPLPVLRVITAERHDAERPGYDRIAFTFTGTFPSYDVRWVDELRADASDQPVHLEGDRILRIRFTQAQAHDDAGNNTVVTAPPEHIGYPAIVSYARAGDFEGIVTYGVGSHHTGSGAQVAIRLTELKTPDGHGGFRYTVAVDIRR